MNHSCKIIEIERANANFCRLKAGCHRSRGHRPRNLIRHEIRPERANQKRAGKIWTALSGQNYFYGLVPRALPSAMIVQTFSLNFLREGAPNSSRGGCAPQNKSYE